MANKLTSLASDKYKEIFKIYSDNRDDTKELQTTDLETSTRLLEQRLPRSYPPNADCVDSIKDDTDCVDCIKDDTNFQYHKAAPSVPCLSPLPSFPFFS